MKKYLLPIYCIFLLPFFFSCSENEAVINENTKPSINQDIEISEFSFTDCITKSYNEEGDFPSIQIIGQADNTLNIKMFNTEFCCGTDSVSFLENYNSNNIEIEIVDNGPFTYCLCPHNLEFSIGPLKEENYILKVIESDNSYSRDTFIIDFIYSQTIDTTIVISQATTLSENPFNLFTTELGGCNGMLKSGKTNIEEGNDTIIFSIDNDILNVFVGLNLTCCIEFGTDSETIGDTLVMQINTLNDEYCDCICFYTFDYFYSNYIGQEFYYQFYIDDFLRFDGYFEIP